MKYGLKVLTISIVLVMVASCVTPCIAVDNSTNNISNSGISLENTSVNVSVENTSETINANDTILAMLIVEEGCKAEQVGCEARQVIYRESLGDLGLDALFVKIKKSEVPALLKNDGVKNVLFPKEFYATFIMRPNKTDFALALNANATVSSTLNKEYLVISGVYSDEEVLKLAEEAEINSLRVKSPGTEMEAKVKAISGKLDGALSSLSLLTPKDKVNVIVELKGIPKYKGLSYKEASEKARESEVVKDAIEVVEDLGGDFIDYWHWYNSIDVEIEASKLLELARYDFIEKMIWGGRKFKIEPIRVEKVISERPDEEINRIIKYINVEKFHEMGYYGSTIKVAILDTGIDASHPEFSDTVVKAGWDGTGNALVDTDGHGTAVASLVNFVAPKAELWSYKISEGNETDLRKIIDGIDRAKKDEVDIISLSWSSIWLNPPYRPWPLPPYDGTWRDGTSDICRHADDAVVNYNKVFVTAAGNEGDNYDYREIGGEAAHYKLDVEKGEDVEIRVWWDDEDGDLGDMPENTLYLEVYDENGNFIKGDHNVGDSFQVVKFTPDTDGTYEAVVYFRPEDYEEGEKQGYHIQIWGSKDYAHFNQSEGVRVGDEVFEYNRFNTTCDPANANYVISVGAISMEKWGTLQEGDKITNFSSRGPTRDGRTKPEVVAPGYMVPVALPGGNYSYYLGTSFAAPLVSGSIALLLQAEKDRWGYVENPINLRDSIIGNALDFAPAPYADNTYGWGLIDAFGCLYGDHNYPKPKVEIAYSKIEEDAVKFKVKLSNTGDPTDNIYNGVFIELENATFESIDKGDFDDVKAYDVRNPEGVDLMPWKFEIPIKGSKVVQFYIAGDDAESGEIVIKPEKELEDVKIKYRAWLFDEDDIIENPYNNESEVNAYLSYDIDDNRLSEGRKEPYIARDPPELEAFVPPYTYNPPYNRHIFDKDFSFLDYSTHVSMPTGVIFVPDDYKKIQWAVDNASAGDTIIVRDGIYYENVVVDKALTIRSENGSDNCIVDGGGSGDVITLNANGITIEGLTVRNSSSSWPYAAGIKVFSNANKIAYNCITSNLYYGIYLDYSSNNIIVNNIVSNNGDGIYLEDSSRNTIADNIISNNALGIGLDDSSSNIIANNTISNNGNGIHLDSSFDSSSNNIITNNNVSNNGGGIYLYESSSNTIANNNVSSNKWNGIYLWESSSNIMVNNTVSNNWVGIYLDDYSNNNIIANNTISSNNLYGIFLYPSSSNIITNNTISNNNIGIRFWDSSRNTIYLNNFINNRDQIVSSYSTNIWNSTEKMTYTYDGTQYTNYLGNYWSDYTGSDADGDGIGDTPYSIDGDKDNYPLMEQFENYIVTPVSNQPPIANFTYYPEKPVVNQSVTFDASSSYDPDGNITSYEWNFGDGNITNTTHEIIKHSYSEAGSYEVTLTVTDNEGATNSTTKIITVYSGAIFDCGEPKDPYPSIMGVHRGTIKPNHTVIATKLYTYPCPGTGGHTEHARIWNATWEATATWEGYAGDWHNISFDKTVVLFAGETYFYEIRTGSYPQIHHTDALLTANGWINCTEFKDANGKVYHDWIPAIKLF